MAIRDLPDSYDEFERFNVEYERAQLRATRTPDTASPSRRATFADGRAIVHALLDEPLLDALGLPASGAPLRRAVEAALRARARPFACCRRAAGRGCARSSGTARYPAGYELEALGPAESR